MAPDSWLKGHAQELLLQVSEFFRLRSCTVPSPTCRGTPITSPNPHPALSPLLVATSSQLLALPGYLQESKEATQTPGKNLRPAQGPGYTGASSPHLTECLPHPQTHTSLTSQNRHPLTPPHRIPPNPPHITSLHLTECPTHGSHFTEHLPQQTTPHRTPPATSHRTSTNSPSENIIPPHRTIPTTPPPRKMTLGQSRSVLLP